MSTATVDRPVDNAGPARRADLGPATGIPLTRLVRVETRKMMDTTAGRWFMISIGLIVALVLTIMFFVDQGNHSFMAYLQATTMPLAILLPILGIMSATQEWGQRTAMTTFALEPRRGRVVSAKIISSLVLGAVAFVLAVGLAALTHLAAVGIQDATPVWEVNSWLVFGAALMLILGMGQGLAFGFILLNTPAAIVTYFVLPMAWSILGELVSWLRDVAAWLDPGVTMMPLQMGEALTGQEWAKVGASMALWLALPLAIGIWRVLRREVK